MPEKREKVQPIGGETRFAVIASIALVTIVANCVSQLLLWRSPRATAKTSTAWDDARLRSVHRSVLTAVWIVDAGYTMAITEARFELEVRDKAMALYDVLRIACVDWLRLRFID